MSAQELARSDVVRLPYVEDVAGLYNSADVFVFPSLEEGGPLVTCEAAYCGLSSIVSPMGAGRIVRDGQEGYVIDPHAEDDWVEATRVLAAQPGLRERMGAAAHERSLSFTWSRVALDRRRALAVVLSGRPIPGARASVASSRPFADDGRGLTAGADAVVLGPVRPRGAMVPQGFCG